MPVNDLGSLGRITQPPFARSHAEARSIEVVIAADAIGATLSDSRLAE